MFQQLSEYDLLKPRSPALPPVCHISTTSQRR